MTFPGLKLTLLKRPGFPSPANDIRCNQSRTFLQLLLYTNTTYRRLSASSLSLTQEAQMIPLDDVNTSRHAVSH